MNLTYFNISVNIGFDRASVLQIGFPQEAESEREFDEKDVH